MGSVQETLDAPMPWVGLYIAAASAVCTLAMAADAFNGFRRKKLWFPCKYFSLNATSLTLLAVAMKLPMDLTTDMFTSVRTDRFAKHFSLIFMSTAMANFMSSLGTMTDQEILGNVVALGILVITIAGNVSIQLIRVDEFIAVRSSIIFIWIPTILMLLLLATLVSMAVTIPTIKRSLELKYQEQHREALSEEEAVKKGEAFTVRNQKRYMMKYWVMAETSSPQFVMARSVVSTTSAFICLLAAIILVTVHIILWASFELGVSSYGFSTIVILYVQSIGVAIGTISPILRWFVAVIFTCSAFEWNSFKSGFKIEDYWTQTLMDWRDSFSALPIPQNKCRKYLHNLKWFTLTFCIGVQILIVFFSKLLVFLSALLLSPFFLCCTHIKKFMKQIEHESGGDRDLNLDRYVLQLEGEAKLPRRVLKSICREANNVIKTGKKKQPRSLIVLLDECVDFSGVGKFDNTQISSLNSKEPPYCWMLPVVTLTSIAIGLPNIAKHKRQRLLSSVSEGLSLAKIIENNLVKSITEIVNIRKAADICWVGVVLYMKWFDVDLRRTSLECKNSKGVLQKLSDSAKKIVTEREVKDRAKENPLNWPAKVVAANSMYRISQTILLACEEENEQTDEGLFKRLSFMIADILAACLTNLPHAITIMCHRNAIEKREKSVRKAFLLLGQTEEVVKLVQRQERPSLDHAKAASIEVWRAWFQQFKDDPATMSSTSSTEAVTAPQAPSSEEYIGVTVDC